MGAKIERHFLQKNDIPHFLVMIDGIKQGKGVKKNSRK
jgi:hypothetical protein